MKTSATREILWLILRAACSVAAGFLAGYISLHYQVPLWLTLPAVIIGGIGGATIGRP